MGTRADFYLGKGVDATWLGSIAWDGNPESILKGILQARTSDKFKKAVSDFFKTRDDVTLPDEGWPWPWVDSKTTDFAYAFFNDKVYWSQFGKNWVDSSTLEDAGIGKPTFPDMTSIQNVALGKRSGLIILHDEKVVK